MNKEQIYDAQIAPLMSQIIGICQERKIAMFATFCIPNDEDPDLSCTTHLPDETDCLPSHLADCRRAVMGKRKFATFAIITKKNETASPRNPEEQIPPPPDPPGGDGSDLPATPQ